MSRLEEIFEDIRAVGRQRQHLIVEPHPDTKLRGVIRLLKHLRGPQDEGWHVQFHIAGRWTPKTPVSLSTKDFHEAAWNAREKFILAQAGHNVAARPKVGPDHRFAIYAERAVAELRATAAAVRAQLGRKKAHKYENLAGLIERVLIPQWGETPITALNEDDLNHWVEHEYRVGDRWAKPGEPTRKPARTTLGNLDHALLHVWAQAAKDRMVAARLRPMINRELGDDSEPRAFIDPDGVAAVCRVMSDEWLAADDGHSADYKRLLRAYVALAATTGIRPGLELERTQIGNIQTVEQEGRQVLLVRVVRNAGKWKRERLVPVYEADVFDVRAILDDLMAWQDTNGAKLGDPLFSWVYKGKRSVPSFAVGVREVLVAAGARIDPMSGEERVAYSFRHYFATQLIGRGLSEMQVAEWLGTSPEMIRRHYNHYLIAAQAHRFNGSSPKHQGTARIRREAIAESRNFPDQPPLGCVPAWDAPDDDQPDGHIPGWDVAENACARAP